MRTTLDLDDELLRAALARFPPGTPKTVVLEEALHQLVRARSVDGGQVRPLGADARLDRLVAEGLVERATRAEAPPPVGPGLPLSRLLDDLARDREDR